MDEKVRFEKFCEMFLDLAGRNLFNTQHGTNMHLTRGEIRQGKQTVLEYALHIRIAASRATELPKDVLCDLFVRGLRSELQNACKRTEHGAIWDGLDACIQYAIGKEQLLPKP
eukprot:96052-Pelagomonas_calceolata.AAC.1